LRIIPSRVIFILLDSFAFQTIYITIYLFMCLKACCTLHENMHRICGSLVNKRERMIFLFLPIASTKSAINKFIYLQFNLEKCPLLIFINSPIKFWRITTSAYNGASREQNLLASSIKCPRENCSKTLTWTRRA